MKRTGLFTKIFIYTFSIFSVLVICLHLAIYFLFPSTYLSHRQETIGQKATAIAQSLEGKDRQSIEQVLDLYSPFPVSILVKISRSKLIIVVFFVLGLTVRRIMESLFPAHGSVRSTFPVSTPIKRMVRGSVASITLVSSPIFL